MFATILGGLPRPPVPSDAPRDEAVRLAIVAQEAAGLEPLTDGRLTWPLDDALEQDVVATWRTAAALTPHAVKQSLPGPYSLARHRGQAANVIAGELRAVVLALAEAGCPLVEIEETGAHRIGNDSAERRAYRDAHLALTDGIDGTHLSLAIVGGNADIAGIETILAPAYSSLAVDLIAGPDNWRLVAQAPTEVGIVAGAMSARADGDEGPEVLLFAARYAASTQGRGPARIGLAIAPGLQEVPWDAAVRKMNAIGKAARIVALPPGDELAESLDPRAIDIRSAGLGRRERRR
jgi:methionine synthase II (cobalamin-independent)